MATRWRVGLSTPRASTICLIQRKFNADAADPSRNPTPHSHPRQAHTTIAPPAPIANIAFQMRSSARSMNAGSSAVILGVPQQLPDQLDEAAGNSEQQSDEIHPVSAECLIERIPDGVPDEGRRRQQE